MEQTYRALGLTIRSEVPLPGLPTTDKIRFQDAVRNWQDPLGKVCSLADAVRGSIVERPREGVTINDVADAIESDFSNSP